jgi:ElaB/YqjD/DUF883 family membrane-anchored ribosome-binding protein
MHAVSTNKLMKDLQAVVIDTEELIKATAGQTGERVEKVRARAEESLRAVRERMQEAGHVVDRNVHENAWTAVGVAAGVGLLLGIVVGRR